MKLDKSNEQLSEYLSDKMDDLCNWFNEHEIHQKYSFYIMMNYLAITSILHGMEWDEFVEVNKIIFDAQKKLLEKKYPDLAETGTSPFGDESEIEETLCNVSNLSHPSQYTEEAQKIDGNLKKDEMPSPYS